jgi:hypothetical protein
MPVKLCGENSSKRSRRHPGAGWTDRTRCLAPLSLQIIAITLATLTATGCASPPQAQLASTQLAAVLSELRTATTTFRNAYVAEIDRTQTELERAVVARSVERAVVARSVKNRVQELSRSFGEPEWHDRFRQQGLIALSEEIEQEQDAARRLVDEIDRIRLRRDERARERGPGTSNRSARRGVAGVCRATACPRCHRGGG